MDVPRSVEDILNSDSEALAELLSQYPEASWLLRNVSGLRDLYLPQFIQRECREYPTHKEVLIYYNTNPNAMTIFTIYHPVVAKQPPRKSHVAIVVKHLFNLPTFLEDSNGSELPQRCMTPATAKIDFSDLPKIGAYITTIECGTADILMPDPSHTTDNAEFTSKLWRNIFT